MRTGVLEQVVRALDLKYSFLAKFGWLDPNIAWQAAKSHCGN